MQWQHRLELLRYYGFRDRENFFPKAEKIRIDGLRVAEFHPAVGELVSMRAGAGSR